jgi:hypothetical protein
MKTTNHSIPEILMTLFSAFTGSVLTGYIFFQSDIFFSNLTTFQFVISGALAAIFFTLLRFTSLRNTIAIYFVVCLFAGGLILNSFRMEVLFRDTLYYLIIGYAVYLFFRYSYNTDVVWNRPLQLAGYFAVLNILITVILLFINNQLPKLLNALTINLSISFLVGLGLGLGIEAGNYFLEKLHITTEEESVATDNES